jgi:hypothetical protein
MGLKKIYVSGQIHPRAIAWLDRLGKFQGNPVTFRLILERLNVSPHEVQKYKKGTR